MNVIAKIVRWHGIYSQPNRFGFPIKSSEKHTGVQLRLGDIPMNTGEDVLGGHDHHGNFSKGWWSLFQHHMKHNQ